MTEQDSALWRDMLDHLRKRHATVCRHWFDQLELIYCDGGLLKIQTDNVIQQGYLQRQCRDAFNDAAQAITGALVAVHFVTSDTAAATLGTTLGDAPSNLPQNTLGQTADHAAPLAPQAQAARQQPVTSTPSIQRDGSDPDEMILNPDYSFDNFVTGPGNDLAYAAATAVSNQLGTAYNPLFIHGGVGLGKTHLLQAICQKVLAEDPTRRLCYLSCEAFVNHFMLCVQHGKMEDFRHRYRHVDLLLIDDIQFLANRDRSQEEFFHTFNVLYQSNKQIVLSSDRPPSEIPELEERLVSRFNWGLVTSVAKPDYETRMAIVRAKLQVRDMNVSDEVISLIATRIDSNAREMEGAITTIQGHAALLNKPIDMALVRQALGEPDATTGGIQITLQIVIDAVTRFYSVKLSDLQSKRRHKSITEPRQVCMWLARQHTRFSLEEIGGYFGGRDHTTVMHSIRMVEQRMELEAQFAEQIQTLELQLAGETETAR